ncbi:MAG: lactate utilization protein [Clostridia bacterium]|nr:lactate utilization protein [Clostridia bacterium]
MQNELINNLNRRGFKAFYFKNADKALDKIQNLIKTTDTVAFGGSQTVMEIGLAQMLMERGNKLFHRSFLSDGETTERIIRDGFQADWYLCSANAMTQDGEIVNTDGTGNRVASTIYGAKNVLFIVGVNKVCKDLNSAFERIRTVAAPLNCQRFGRDNPCTRGEDCSNCEIDKTICKATVIHHHPTTKQNAFVIIIDQKLGY